MVEFIDAHRGEFGVEPICRALQFAPSTYYDAKSRPESQRARRHRAMGAVLVSIWAANWRVYGARKLWVAARRAGHDIGRDQVARLMRAAGISGATRQRRVHTTKADPCAHRPGDLVRRDFTAAAPNRLWVTDLTVVPTRTGAAYLCLIVDAFSRRIVGWRVAAHMRTSMVLDALEMARRSRGAQLEGLAVHSDRLSPPSSPPSATPSASPRSAPRPQSDRWATPTTTRWPRPSSASTKPSSSAAPTRGPGTTAQT